MNPLRGRSTITQRLSLRPPQAVSLEILADVLDRIDATESAAIRVVRSPQSAQPIRQWRISSGIFPRCALRWRPASARRGSWARSSLSLSRLGKSRHFFVLAPNMTIYDKLIARFLPGHSEIRVPGYRRIRAKPAAHHHRRQLRDRSRRPPRQGPLDRSVRRGRSRQHLQHRQDQ